MKCALRLAGLFLLPAASSFAEWDVGRGAVELETSLSGVYDSNIRASADEVSDYYLTFEPVVRYRDVGARFQTNAFVGGLFKRYLDHAVFDSNDANARLDWAMQRTEGYTTGAMFSTGYVETTDPVLEVNDIVRTRTAFFNGSGEVLVARNNLLTANLSYRDSNRSIGSDQTFYQGGVGYSFVGFTDGTVLGTNYLHQRNKTDDSTFGTPGLDQKADSIAGFVSHPIYAGVTGTLTGGYRWLDRGTQEAALGLPDQHGVFYSLGLTGAFLPRQYFPKLTGTLRISYEEAQAPGLNERSNKRIVGQVGLVWAARERTQVTLTAIRTQDLSVEDTTIVSTGGALEIAQRIGNFIRAGLALRYMDADFVNLNRTDRRYDADLNGSYQLNRAWSTRLSYHFLRSDSNVAIADYHRNTVSLTLSYVF